MNEAQVMNLVTQVLGVQPLSALHQTFGHNSVTFDVTLPERSVIVRTNTDPQVFATTEHNLAVLAELGLPVPKVIASDFAQYQHPFAWMILDKIPGRDLRYEPGAMTPEQMTRLWGITAEQEHIFALYSAAMSLDFMRRFSKAETPEWNARMLAAVEQWLRGVEA